MAVIRVNYVKKGQHARSGAKANIRYIENRTGKDGARRQRTLFSATGEITRQQAYALIDAASEGSTFFRVKISPDPTKEDTMKDLLLREITAKTLDMEEKIGLPVTWVATIHDDHTAIRHMHVLLIAKARLLPVQAMRQMATEAALVQRRGLDLAREQQQAREKEADAWEREP
jgi:hypothetical protein